MNARNERNYQKHLQ
jgi:hypothetical protein